jgi:2-dehydropantoate 2-reductase
MGRIAIVGPGAIGGVIAAWLAHTGSHEVVLCARRSIEKLTVETPSGVLESHPIVWTDPDAAEPVDWVLVATKAYDAEGAAAWFPRLRTDKTPVAVLQNGVEHRERFSSYIPNDCIVPVIVECPAERQNPTFIRQRRKARLVVGSDPLGKEFGALFSKTDIEVAITEDFTTAAWTKLCLNAAGVLSGILLQPSGIMHDENVAEAARNIVRECVAVGRAEGAVLSDSLADSVVQHYRNQPPDSLNSLHADRLAGRQSEIDARNGVIVRKGLKHRISTPCNQMAAAIVGAQTKLK